MMLHTKELVMISFAIFFLLVPILNRNDVTFYTQNTQHNMSFVFVSPW
jgi:hypothetical protein